MIQSMKRLKARDLSISVGEPESVKETYQNGSQETEAGPFFEGAGACEKKHRLPNTD